MHHITRVWKGCEECTWQLDIFCLVVGAIQTGDLVGGGSMKLGGEGKVERGHKRQKDSLLYFFAIP